MFGYLQRLIPDMLQDLRDNRSGSPGYLGDNYTNEEGILVNDTCHAEWDKILDKMIFLWRESREETCSRKNPFEEEYDKAFDEFHEKYGVLGEKLQTEAELEENRKRGGGGTVILCTSYQNIRISLKSIGRKNVSWKRTEKSARMRRLIC